MSKMSRGLIAAVLLAACTACTSVNQPEPVAGRWIRFDPQSQRYDIDAVQVPRSVLLGELKKIAQAEVRPLPETDDPVTAKAEGLDLDGLLALLMPPGSRFAVREGEVDRASATGGNDRRKAGPPLSTAAGRVAKPDAAIERVATAPKGVVKQAADLPYLALESVGAGTKPSAAMLIRVADSQGPKQPLPRRIERSTVRVVLQFDEGAPPRVIDVQTIEGVAPPQRFVIGSYLYAVIGADGRVLESGTFQDPLVQRSYQQQGPHAEMRAKSGTVGISIAREHLNGARLQVVDAAELSLPRELDDEVVRNALAQGRPSLRLDTTTILRRLDQGN